MVLGVNQMNLIKIKVAEPKPYQELRALAYPAVGDQLDAMWKGGEAATTMASVIQAVKDKYPKDVQP
jgi:hypothetical protein